MSVHFPESLSLESILAERCMHHHQDSELEWLAKGHPETNPITIKPDIASHVAEQFSWVPLPYCSPPGIPFPIKSLALSAGVSPWTIHFWVLDKSPVSGPGRGQLPATVLGQGLPGSPFKTHCLCYPTPQPSSFLSKAHPLSHHFGLTSL